MTTLAPTVATATPTSPPRPLSTRTRWVAGAVLVAASGLQLVEEMLTPAGDGVEQMRWIAAHADRYALDKAIGLAAVPLLIGSILILARLSVARSRRLAWAGGIAGVIAMVGLATVHGFEFAQLAMLTGGVSPEDVTAASENVNAVYAIPILVMFLGGALLGLPLLIAAAWRARAVPRGALIVMAAFLAFDFFAPDTFFPAHALLFIAFTWIAVSLVVDDRAEAAAAATG